MLRWMLLLSALCLLTASSAFGQSFAVIWYYMPDNNTPLLTACEGGVPIPDGYVVKILWDDDSDGPDLDDSLAILCNAPPICEDGPVGTHNRNFFLMNGMAQMGAVGYFAMEAAFASVGGLPTPSRYYLRMYQADGVTPLWTSIVYTFASGAQEVFMNQADWACGNSGPQCIVIDEQE